MKPHHREIKKLTSKDSVKLLEDLNYGHLACHLKQDIFLVPITYAFEDGYIYSHSRNGQKIKMMRKNPMVCFQVEAVKNFYQWKSVIAWGKFEELRGQDATMGMRLLEQRIALNEGRKISPLELDFSALLETVNIYRIKVKKMTGRCEGY